MEGVEEDQAESPAMRRLREAAERDREIIAKQRQLGKPEDFYYDRSQRVPTFWDRRDSRPYGAEGVNRNILREYWRQVPAPEGARNQTARLVKPTEDISDVESDQQVEGATWWPGQPQIIKDVLIGAAGVRKQHGYRLFNTYVPPAPLAEHEGCEVPTLWIEHVETAYPEPTESSIFFDYAAHMVQRPEEKPNFGLVLVGAQGIGKDTMLLPLQYAVGTHNARVIEPDGLFDRFSRPGEQVMLCINEWRSAKDDHKQWSLYEACKHLLAAPPLKRSKA